MQYNISDYEIDLFKQHLEIIKNFSFINKKKNWLNRRIMLSQKYFYKIHKSRTQKKIIKQIFSFVIL